MPIDTPKTKAKSAGKWDRKVAGLPQWGWAVLGITVVGGVIILKRRKSAPAAASTDPGLSSAFAGRDPYGDTGWGGGGGSYGGGGSSGTPIVDPTQPTAPDNSGDPLDMLQANIISAGGQGSAISNPLGTVAALSPYTNLLTGSYGQQVRQTVDTNVNAGTYRWPSAIDTSGLSGDALTNALAGATNFARQNGVNVIVPGANGGQITIPAAGAPDAPGGYQFPTASAASPTNGAYVPQIQPPAPPNVVAPASSSAYLQAMNMQAQIDALKKLPASQSNFLNALNLQSQIDKLKGK